MLTHQVRQLNDDRLCITAVGQEGHLARHRNAITDHTNSHRNEHRDHHPDGRDPTGIVKLLFLLDGHKAQQDVRHTKVAQTPRQRGDDAEPPEGSRAAGCHIIALGHAQVAGQRLGIGNDGIHTARLLDAKHHYNDQRNGHKDGLDQVGEGNRHKTAQHCIANDYNSAYDHRGMVIHPKQAVEQRTDGLKAGSGIGDKENQDYHRRNGGKQVFLIAIPAGEKVRHGDGPNAGRIAPQPPRYDKPVEVGAYRQPDAGPGNLRQAAQVCQSRQTHQQVAAHIAGLSAHGRYQRAHLAAAQVKVIAAVAAALFAKVYTDEHHGNQVYRYGYQNNYLRT